MNEGRTIFAQLMDSLPRFEFQQCVQRYPGTRRIRSFSHLDQFYCMAFAQLTGREGLRDIETCLRALGPKLYHLGIRGHVARSTLADANETRSWRIYADFAQVLLGIARRLYVHEPFGVELDETVYALDSTTIDLCLALFPWAQFRRRKAAVKLHTLLDLRGNLPTVVIITSGKVHDVNILDQLSFEAGAIYIFDRGYLDFERLYRIHAAKAFFITRAKTNFDAHRLYSRPIDKSTGLRCDQTVLLNGVRTSLDYPDRLRRIVYVDPDQGKRFEFITNHFAVPALVIAQLYKCRWQVELFFKWIKQHLRIKAFFGTSENAVKTQVWIALSVYLLVAIVKKRLALPHSLYTILQVLSLTLFEKTPILQALSYADYRIEEDPQCRQLNLFDF